MSTTTNNTTTTTTSNEKVANNKRMKKKAMDQLEEDILLFYCPFTPYLFSILRCNPIHLLYLINIDTTLEPFFPAFG